jgi:uncharacterized membrane protein
MLTESEKKAIADAIHDAELLTSGEIRVHVDKKCSGEPVKRAIEVFGNLGMHATAERNGVLIYIAFDSHKLAIIGDQGINDKVPVGFWDSTRDEMIAFFKKGAYAEGLIAAVKEAGEQLQRYFPRKENDQNELSNEVTYS